MGVFCIGKFPEEDDAVAVFPKIWILDGSSQCYWPNKNVRKAVSKQKIPDQNWTLCEVVILQEFDSFLEAQNNLNLATITSDLETSNKRKEKVVVRAIPVPPVPPVLDLETSNIDLVNAGINEIEQGINDDFQEIIEPCPIVETVHASTQTEDKFESCRDIIQGIQKDIAGIQDNQKEHSETLELILNHVLSLSGATINTQQQQQQQVELIQEKFVFPMTSEAVLLELNSYLSTEAAKFSLIRFMMGTGGADAEEAVKRVLEKLMTDDLASKFSLRGKRGKESLSQYGHLIIALMDCVRTFPSLTIALNTGRLDEIPMEKAISTALKKASDRVFQRKKKAAAQAQGAHSDNIV